MIRQVSRAAPTSGLRPRKVIVGTVVRRFYGPHPDISRRLAELTKIIERMAAQSRTRYGKGLDLAVLSESVVNGEPGSDAFRWSNPLAGPIHAAFRMAARRHHCYIVAGMNLLEDPKKRICSNAAVLFDRQGRVAGIYRKMHPVPSQPGSPVSVEGGMTPGRRAPVFTCDFGRLGIQICYDIEFDAGWDALARANADLIAWPTQSPQLARPAARALQHGFHIVSSTWKQNASVFDPMGRVAAQVRGGDDVLVTELDLSWALLSWSPTLHNGELLKKRFGTRVGFRYSDDEDRGLFWSNDRNLPIGRMIRSVGLLEWPADHARAARIIRNTPRYQRKNR